jgi:hypothetical protein
MIKKPSSGSNGMMRIAAAMLNNNNATYLQELNKIPRNLVLYWSNPYCSLTGFKDYYKLYRIVVDHANQPKLNKLSRKLRKAWQEGKDVKRLECAFDNEFYKVYKIRKEDREMIKNTICKNAFVGAIYE